VGIPGCVVLEGRYGHPRGLPQRCSPGAVLGARAGLDGWDLGEHPKLANELWDSAVYTATKHRVAKLRT